MNLTVSGQNSELMSAWKLHDYNGITSVKLIENLPIPQIKKAKDVLIEVFAASVNTLDVMMTGIVGIVCIILFSCLLMIHVYCFAGAVCCDVESQMVMEEFCLKKSSALIYP